MPSFIFYSLVTAGFLLGGILLCVVSFLVKFNTKANKWFLMLGCFCFVLCAGFAALALSLFMGKYFAWF